MEHPLTESQALWGILEADETAITQRTCGPPELVRAGSSHQVWVQHQGKPLRARTQLQINLLQVNSKQSHQEINENGRELRRDSVQPKYRKEAKRERQGGSNSEFL